MEQKIVTRFAPSPTGFLHIGGVRTALYAYLFAKKHNGTFILRIEDTDKSREVDGAIAHIQESLHWIGLEWDFGPEKPGVFNSCIQSERLPIYKAYAEKLIEKGLAYADPYTAEEVAGFKSEAEVKKVPFLFRNFRPEHQLTWDGTQPLRLKVPEIKRYTWEDAVRGELSAGPEALDDVVLIKSDGYPTYTFAHIVDDFEMGVTHVMRGDEFISSVPKFLSIYDALEIPYPVFVTLPPILRDDRTKKLGKRDGAKDILDYRTDGYLPETMMNFLALIGWNPGTEQELFSESELIAAFDIDGIQRGGAAFNTDKLDWMNKEYLAKLSDAKFAAYLAVDMPDRLTSLPAFTEASFARLTPTIRERVHTREEWHEGVAAGEYDFAFSPVTPTPELLQWKKDASPTDALPRLQQVHTLLEDADFTSLDTIKDALWPYAEEAGKGEVLWPLRVALTALERSPDPFTCAFVLGKEESRARVQNAVDILSSSS